MSRKLVHLALLGVSLFTFQVGVAQAGSHQSSGDAGAYEYGDGSSDSYSSGGGASGSYDSGGGDASGSYSSGDDDASDSYSSGGGDAYSPGGASGGGQSGDHSCDHGANPVEQAQHLKHCALHCGLGVVPAMPGKDCMHKGIMCVTHCALGDIKLDNTLALGKLGGLALKLNLGHSWDVGAKLNSAAGDQYGSGPKGVGVNVSLKADKPLLGQQILGGQ